MNFEIYQKLICQNTLYQYNFLCFRGVLYVLHAFEKNHRRDRVSFKGDIIHEPIITTRPHIHIQ